MQTAAKQANIPHIQALTRPVSHNQALTNRPQCRRNEIRTEADHGAKQKLGPPGQTKRKPQSERPGLKQRGILRVSVCG